jgi:chemotaxis protein methyltransferase CheR
MSLRQTSCREFEFSPQEFAFIAHFAYEKTGITLSERKRDMIYNRLVKRLRELGIATFADYCKKLQSNRASEEIPHLINAITTNITHFFRENHHFEHLANEVLRRKCEQKASRLRIWSAGCSSGMEAYSIAMTLADSLKSLPKCDMKILATDIDTNMLSIGSKGEYPASNAEKIAEKYERFYQIHGDSISMKDTVKKLISFKPLNLHEPWPMRGPFDVIFCRNVVIYFDKATQRTLFDRMAELMPVGGTLYIGHSENITQITNKFKLLSKTTYIRV